MFFVLKRGLDLRRLFSFTGLVLLFSISFCPADFIAYNDCIRGTGDTTAANTTNWTIYNNYTSSTSGTLIDFSTGRPTPVTATFTWNASAGLATSEVSGSEDGISQPRPGTPAYAVFGGIVDFSNRLIYYGTSGWWVEIEFTGLDPAKTYSFVTTAIRANNYLSRRSLFTISNHLSAVNNSSEGIDSINGDQTTLIAGGNHLDTTGYVVRWDDIRVADQGDGTGSFKVRAEATGSDYRAYPFGGFMLEEISRNTEPTVSAGQDRTIHLPKEYLTLTGSVSDDGRGSPDGFLESTWSQVSGPQAVTFTTNIHQPEVTAQFPAAGDYELQLTATDGELAASDTVMITVADPICPVGDIDGDCIVRLADLSLLAQGWMEGPAVSPSDLNGDKLIDADELDLLGQSWLENWTGSLQVTLSPTEAITAGAMWRVDGGVWQSSGTTVTSLPEGDHDIEYSLVPGWVAAKTETVRITRRQTTVTTGQYAVPPRTLAISEFMAVNSNVLDLRPVPTVNLYTSVNGEPAYDDWIELKNLTDEAVSLDGWYLTDDPDNLTKWRFPDGYSIPAQGRFVVYASNKDSDKYGYPFIDDLGNLHTNFDLSIGGEYLALVRPDGHYIEQAYDDYPEQRGLVSYGLAFDDPDTIGYLTGPTRGTANTGIYDGLVADMKFSEDRGFYENPFTVEITCATAGAVIHYTTDNSEPTALHGNIYTGPITIAATTCLRAAAFKPKYLASNVDTQTYLFLDNVLTQATNPSTGAQVTPTGYPTSWGSVTGDYQVDPEITDPAGAFGSLYAGTIKDDLKAIPSISIVVPVDQLFGSTGIYINQAQDGTERAGSVELLDPDGVEKFHTNCGVRMQGGASEVAGGTTLDRWKCYKLSFRLMFRGIFGGQLDYPLFGADAADTYNTVVLDSRPQNTWVHSDPTQRTRGEYVRDQVSSDTQLALGGYACHGRPVHLYINGLYWGLYWMHERPDGAFAAAYMGGDKEDYDVIKHVYNNAISGSFDDYVAMFNISANVGGDEVAAFENLKQKLDVADFIDYMLANYYIGNGDWDNKNWYATHNHSDPDGRWRWHMWDGEHVLDDGTMAAGNVTGKNNSMAPTGLQWKWIGNAEYRMLFADRVQKHFFHNGALIPGNYANLFTHLTDQIDRAIVGESARWGDNRINLSPYKRYTRNADWLTEVNRLLTSFIPTRRDVVLAQFTSKSPRWYPSTNAPEFYINGSAQYGGDAATGSALTMSNGDNAIYYTVDGSDPRLPGGAINTASTFIYTGALSLTKATRVKARAKNGGEWSALSEAVFNTDPIIDNLRITELMYHPADPNCEFIELKNIGDEAINLNRVRFTKGIEHTFGDVTVGADGYLLLVKNKLLFEIAYTDIPAGVPVIQWDAGSLDNDGDKVKCVDALGRTVQSFTYKDGWYPLTDGDGFSLTIIDPLADTLLWDEKEGWRASTTAGGSPGTDEVGLVPDSIVINEILAHSHETLPDWIELHNTTDQTISVGGWFLSDNNHNLTKYQIPQNTEIPAGGFVVFYEDTDFGAAFALSENGETLYLTSGAGGQITGYQTSQSFDASERAVSMGRYITSTGDMDFVAMSNPTPGAANAYPQVGPVVISEIQYNPGDDNRGNEYIELHNISDRTVYLEDSVETETAPGVFENQTVSWAFTDGIEFLFPAGTAIEPGGYLIVAKDVSAFNAYYTALPAGTEVLGPFDDNTSLSNGGEKLRLCKPGEKLFDEEEDGDDDIDDRSWIRVDQVTYDDESPWPLEADGQGRSLQRINRAAYGNDPINWTAPAPSPGQ